MAAGGHGRPRGPGGPGRQAGEVGEARDKTDSEVLHDAPKSRELRRKDTQSLSDLEFLPDPDAIERRPLGGSPARFFSC